MKKLLLYFISPLSLYQDIKRRRLLKRYKSNNLNVGENVSVTNTRLGKNNYLSSNSIISDSELGDYSYLGVNANISHAKIGRFCSIGPNVTIGTGKHPVDFISTHPSFYSNNKAFETFADKMYFDEYQETTIGNDVWIGMQATIMGGLNIGDGAVIAGGAVVTKDVPPYAIVGGVPAKILKYRFDEETIHFLLETKWWNNDRDFLKTHFKKFHTPEAFRELHQNNNPDTLK